MLLLVTTGHPDMERYAHPNLGRLLQPRHYSSAKRTALSGVPWAADNDCFQGLDAAAYVRMLDAIAGLPGCLFVTVPDVVADANATLELWREWVDRVSDRQLPAAFVLQDGITADRVPWHECAAVFVGGSTEWKLGSVAADLVREAHARGKWSHMGRVNTLRRIIYAQSIGCRSIDGSQWARFKRTYLRDGLRAVSNGRQLSLLTCEQSS